MPDIPLYPGDYNPVKPAGWVDGMRVSGPQLTLIDYMAAYGAAAVWTAGGSFTPLTTIDINGNGGEGDDYGLDVEHLHATNFTVTLVDAVDLNVSDDLDVNGSTTVATLSASGAIASEAAISASTTITAGTALVAGTTVTAGTGITATTGNIIATTGNIVATVGNIVATTGLIIAAEDNIVATNGSFVATNGGMTSYDDIVVLSGDLVANNGEVRAEVGNITATLGDISTGAGDIDSGRDISSDRDIDCGRNLAVTGSSVIGGNISTPSSISAGVAVSAPSFIYTGGTQYRYTTIAPCDIRPIQGGANEFILAPFSVVAEESGAASASVAFSFRIPKNAIIDAVYLSVYTDGEESAVDSFELFYRNANESSPVEVFNTAVDHTNGVKSMIVFPADGGSYVDAQTGSDPLNSAGIGYYLARYIWTYDDTEGGAQVAEIFGAKVKWHYATSGIFSNAT